MSAEVTILMGSKSDLETMKPAAEVLKKLGLRSEVRVLSAHRTPEQTAAFVRNATAGGTKVFICGAGGAAHLAGAVAAHTTRLRLATGVVVLPFRHPVTLAKQAATFDHFCKGRLILGVGVGAYREEFVAMYGGGAGVVRGDMVTEHLEALRLLFTERRPTYKGKYYQFTDVESYPKPLQNPLPLWVAGNAEAGVRRAARFGTGWLPAILSAKEIGDRVAILRRAAEEAGRDPVKIEIAPQFAVAIGETAKEAEATFKRSQLYHHLESLRQSTLKEQAGSFDERSLTGTPEMICEQVERFRRAGVTCCAGLYFIGNTVDENIAAMRLFANRVMPNFP